MNTSKPEFHLRRVFADGSLGPPEIHPLHELPSDAQLSRRGFVGAGVGIASLLASLTGCKRSKEMKPPKLAATPPPERSKVVPPPARPPALVDPKKPTPVTTPQEPPKETPKTPGRTASKIQAHANSVSALAISPDGRMLASASASESQGGTIAKLWSLPDGKLLRKLTAPGGKGAARLAFSPDGACLATMSNETNNTLRLWSVEDGRLLSNVTSFVGDSDFQISSDGKMVVTVARQKEVKIWSLPDGRELKSIPNNYSSIQDWILTADAKGIVVALSDGTVRILSLPEGNLLATLKSPSDHPTDTILALSADGKTLLARATRHFGVRVWSLPEGKHLGDFSAEDAADNSPAMTIAPNGQLIAAWVEEKTPPTPPSKLSGRTESVGLWPLPGGTPARRIATGKPGAVGWRRHAVFTPDSASLLTCSSANLGGQNISLWSIADGSPRTTLKGHGMIEKIAVTQDGKLVVTGDQGGVIMIWSLPDGKLLGYAFDPAASTTDGNTYNVVDQATGRTITYTLPCGSPIPAGAICTCNCVPGTYRAPVSTPSSTGGSYRVCTCIPVRIFRCDRDSKTDVEPVDPEAILERLARMPVQRWRYKEDAPGDTHIGPMAQDFADAFGAGGDDRSIHGIDAHGVAFAAIQGLHRRLARREAFDRELLEHLNTLRRQNEAILSRLDSLESRLPPAGGTSPG